MKKRLKPDFFGRLSHQRAQGRPLTIGGLDVFGFRTKNTRIDTLDSKIIRAMSDWVTRALDYKTNATCLLTI